MASLLYGFNRWALPGSIKNRIDGYFRRFLLTEPLLEKKYDLSYIYRPKVWHVLRCSVLS